MHNFCRK